MTKRALRFEVESMDTQERVEQLGKIDQLRELGVDAEISLPQVSFSPTTSLHNDFVVNHC